MTNGKPPKGTGMEAQKATEIGMCRNQVVLLVKVCISHKRFCHSILIFPYSELSYRCDLESLGHIMVYFFGVRPQRHLSSEQLCQGLPDAFATYFRHVRSLSASQKPDYSQLRKILNHLFLYEGFQRDYVLCVRLSRLKMQGDRRCH